MSARAWCYTLNNFTLLEQVEVENIDCRYHTYGKEIGEQGTQHLQGYIEFSNVKRLAGVKKLIPRAHWEQRRGTREEARDYCRKEDTEPFEKGEWIVGQGNRSDLHRVMQMTKDGHTKLEIMEEYPETSARYIRFAAEYRAAIEKEQTKVFREVRTIVLWGDAGTGKTRTAHEEHPDIFTVCPGETFPFDGYDGEAAILIDDFYGQLKYHDMLRILDGHQLKVNIKGGLRYAQWTTVYITSNNEPSNWYQLGMTPALKRRLTEVHHFCNKVDRNEVDG